LGANSRNAVGPFLPIGTNMKAGIYKISVGPWFYWGQTNNFKRREKEHLRTLTNKKHRNILLRRAFDKYQTYEFEIISVIEDPNERTEWEQDILDVWYGTENCANINPTAEAPFSTKGMRLGPHSEEHRIKISSSNVGKHSHPHREETKAKIATSLKGQKREPYSEEHKAKIASSLKTYWEHKRSQ
jgi:group I intron endonuclease